MRVFKFGGASIKDADSVRNVLTVLQNYSGEDLVIVVSAMGKTTNRMEQILKAFLEEDGSLDSKLQELRSFHFDILKDLFPNPEHRVYNEVEITFSQLEIILQGKQEGNYNKLYDLIVPFGELISTKIISAFLSENQNDNEWLDARKLVRTDSNYRFARIEWEQTSELVTEALAKGQCFIVQGFIGSDAEQNSTTLGREGSDYTASIFAYVLDADEVIIWKDVPGVLNGDPKVFEDTQLLNQLSFREAIELAYYGASVIHPKTIQPLKRKDIPLKVKSFLKPKNEGTTISNGLDLEPVLPCYIQKTGQVLISLSTKDLAFIVEDHLSIIYRIFHDFGVRVNLSQNTAVSSSFCINHDAVVTPQLLEALKAEFRTSYNENVNLYTVRHYDDEAKEKVRQTGKVLLEQISRNTYQVVTF